tara:strand:+ start:493 stop:1311 length:819 start_codon:yes stop_codon:yes gene_type:complete
MDISNLNKQQIANLLKEGKRNDGRELLAYRELEVETGISINAEGSARVKLGKTEVIVGVKMATQEPYPDHDDEGTLMTGMEFSPMAGSRYESGPPKINSIETARVVDRGIRESNFIDFKKLCIEKGKKAWSISVDMYCINDDGDALDACALGALIALKTAKLPVYDKETETVKHGELSDEGLPLTDNIPLTMTFHKIKGNIFMDPTRTEEDTTDARVTFSISKPKKDYIINSMQKGEMDSITCDELEEMAEKAGKVYEDIFPKIEKVINESA